MKTELQKLRKAAGFRSAKAFAEHMGMSDRTYTNYEQGVNKLTLEQAWLFADALGEAMGRHVSLDELAGRDWPRIEASLTPEERALMEAYRAANPQGRAAIDAVAGASQGVGADAGRRVAPGGVGA